MAKEKRYFVYLVTNWARNVMYVGVTSDLARRIHEHKAHAVAGFTQRYNVDKLVYFEETSDVPAAIQREKEIKKWRRGKKDALVSKANPEWRDFAVELGLVPDSASDTAPDSLGASDAKQISPFGRNDSQDEDRGHSSFRAQREIFSLKVRHGATEPCNVPHFARDGGKRQFLPSVQMTTLNVIN